MTSRKQKKERWRDKHGDGQRDRMTGTVREWMTQREMDER